MKKINLLLIKQIFVSILDKPVLEDICLAIEPGSIHAIMGPNGSGKSSLAYTLMGHPSYAITAGSIQLNGSDLADMPVHERARNGMFLSFQHPLEIAGVSVASFLREAYNARHEHVLTVADFRNVLLERCAQLDINPSFIERGMNDGFSGGEKKRFELLQLLLLQPKVAILDEIDSGLDIDSLKLIARSLELAQKENPSMAIILITHYQRILNYLIPDYVHVLCNGKITVSGDATVAHQLEAKGYEGYKGPQ